MPVHLVEAHRATVRTDVRDLVGDLNAALGPTLVAVLAGVKDRKLPTRWAAPDGPNPRDASLSRLQTAHRVWRLIAESEGGSVARAWFIGLNPLLDEVPPVVALNQGDERGVLAAAQAFVQSDGVDDGAGEQHLDDHPRRPQAAGW